MGGVLECLAVSSRTIGALANQVCDDARSVLVPVVTKLNRPLRGGVNCVTHRGMVLNVISSNVRLGTYLEPRAAAAAERPFIEIVAGHRS